MGKINFLFMLLAPFKSDSRWIFRALLWFSLIGLFASVYLLITYISGAPIVCGLVSGCELIRASKWAYTWGVPRPLLGVVFYSVVIILLTVRAYAPAWQRRLWHGLLLVFTTIGLIESGGLTLVQWFELKAFCLWCLTSAVAATSLFILCLCLQFSRSSSTRFFGAPFHPVEADLKELKYTFQACLVALLAGGLALWWLL